VIFGAAGNLALSKLLPALFERFLSNGLGACQVVGVGRRNLSSLLWRELVKKALPREADAFLARCTFVQVQDLANSACYAALSAAVAAHEAAHGEGSTVGRLCYLATPPDAFAAAAAGARAALTPPPGRGWLRLVVEKPFGHDVASAKVLDTSLRNLYEETELYRIDHYLGKEMVRNLLVLRFSNPILGPLFCARSVAAVCITLKETRGAEEQATYFDHAGIIRDVVQNHLLQVLALVAMERPVSLAAEDLRDEKTKLLRCVQAPAPQDAVIGRYNGYPGAARTATFAQVVVRVWSERWAGVPFILKAAKGMDAAKMEVRIQFKPSLIDVCAAGLAPPGLQPASAGRNELVLQVQPREALWLKVTVKAPPGVPATPPTARACDCVGATPLSTPPPAAIPTVLAELALDYNSRWAGGRVPNAYELLLQDAVDGDPSSFVRADFAAHAWRVFDPLLAALEAPGAPPPLSYARGTRGPAAAMAAAAAAGYVRSEGYVWQAARTA